ncbi:MAG TPA: hypothetical protein VI776_06450 [Anaerolineales bacterium]|nr:hypothetical protein [Anaerolineales bacterium]
MEPLEILKRSWKILWSYRALWVFALILGLTAGGGSTGWGGNGNRFQYQMDNNQDFREFIRQLQRLFGGELPRMNIPGDVWTTVMWVILGIILVVLIVAVVFTILRYVSEAAVIRMVDAQERTAEKPGVRAGFRLGWSRAAWRLFLINLLVNLPLFFMVLFLVLVGLGFFWTAMQGSLQATSIPGWIVLGLVLAPLTLVVIALSVVLNLFRQFFWRASALEGIGVGEAFRRGYALVRRNWQNVALMWLILVGIGIAWAVAMFVAFFLLIPVYIVTGLAGLIAGGLPALLVGGIASLFLGEWIPWVLAAIVGLPIFLLVTFSPLLFLSGLGKIFTSTAWTLTYRELAALESLAPAPEPAG